MNSQREQRDNQRDTQINECFKQMSSAIAQLTNQQALGASMFNQGGYNQWPPAQNYDSYRSTAACMGSNPGLGGECFYCNKYGHHIQACPHLRDHLEKGWLVKNEQGYICLPNGAPVRSEGSKLQRKVVEEINHPRPGLIPAKKVQFQVSSFLQEPIGEEHRVSELDQIQYKTAAKYNAAQSVKALGCEYGNDVVAQLLKEIYLGDTVETEDSYKGNFL